MIGMGNGRLRAAPSIVLLAALTVFSAGRVARAGHCDGVFIFGGADSSPAPRVGGDVREASCGLPTEVDVDLLPASRQVWVVAYFDRFPESGPAPSGELSIWQAYAEVEVCADATLEFTVNRAAHRWESQTITAAQGCARDYAIVHVESDAGNEVTKRYRGVGAILCESGVLVCPH